MAEINMSDYDTFDENIGALKSNLSSKDKVEYYLGRLSERIQGEASIGKIRDEVYNFIYVNTMMDPEIKKKLIDFVDGSGYVDGNKLSSDILSYLKNAYDEAEYEFTEDNKKMDEVKTDFVDRVNKKLNDSKVELVGNDDTIKEALESEENLDKLNSEINAVNDFLKGSSEHFELTTDDLKEAVNSTRDNVLVDKIQEQINNKFKVTEEGTIEIDGSLLNNNDQNYIAMMMVGLVASDLNLDMYLSKDRKNNSDYTVTFGNLPIKNHPENRLDPSVIEKINEIHNSYDSTVNYQERLYKTDTTIGTLNDIIFDEMNEDGTMKVGINNHDGNYVIGLNMSSEYQNLADAFNTNGALVSMDGNQNNIVRLDGDSIDQYSILVNTKETLEKEEEMKNQMTDEYQLRKTIGAEAAKVNPYFLTVVAIAEVLLIGFYFVFLFK